MQWLFFIFTGVLQRTHCVLMCAKRVKGLSRGEAGVGRDLACTCRKDCTGLQQLKQLTMKDLFAILFCYLYLSLLFFLWPANAFWTNCFLFTKLVTCFKTASHMKIGSKTMDCLLKGADLFDECHYSLLNLVNMRSVKGCQHFCWQVSLHTG